MISSAANSVQRRTARQHERSRWLTRFLPIALVLGLLGGGLGATLDALPAAASTVSGVLFSGSSHIAGETDVYKRQDARCRAQCPTHRSSPMKS